MRLFFAIAAMSAVLVVACTHDFSSFESTTLPADAATGDTTVITTPPSSEDAGDVSTDADAAADAAPRDGGCEVSCVATEKTCGTACDSTATTCKGKCRNRDFLCALGCSNAQSSCKRDCQSTCKSCGGAACNAACN